MCIIDDEYGPEFFSTRNNKARLEHKCVECGRMIQPGETYEVISGKWDGIVGTYKTCLHCQSARQWLHEVCGGWAFGCVLEDLEEHHRDGYGPWLKKAATCIRHKWQRKDGSLMKPLTLPANLPVGH